MSCCSTERLVCCLPPLTINAGDDLRSVERRMEASPQLCNKGLGANVAVSKDERQCAPSPQNIGVETTKDLL